MDTVSLRQAVDGDVEALVELYHSFHAFHARNLPDWLRLPPDGGWGDERTREVLGEILRDEKAVIFIAEADGKPIGLAEAYLREDEESALVVGRRCGYVQSLFVIEKRRGVGIGRRLLEACEHWSQERGATHMQLSTWEFAAGPLGFYEAQGYATIKRVLTRALVK